MSNADDVLEFWFSALTAEGAVEPDVSARWWKKDPDFDELIRKRFGETHQQAASGTLDEWATTPRGRVALVILLDQFSRNLFRGDARTFAQDPKALALALEGIERGEHERIAPMEAYFLLMPLMHSEDRDAQNRVGGLFESLAASTEAEGPKKLLLGGAHYAKLHRDIVVRFGRFPHRNAVLGRESTPEEVEFLKQPGSSF